MNKILPFLIIVLCFCISCKVKISGNKSNYELTIKEKDSAFKILEKLCGDWEIEKKLDQDYNLKGIYFLPMTIDCWVEIDGKLINQFSTSHMGAMSRINIKAPKNIDKLFFKESDSIIISKENKYYGLKYTKEKRGNFIPINKINDSILILVDGRKYQKKMN